MAVVHRRASYARTALCVAVLLALGGCGGDGTTPELRATRETPPGGTQPEDLDATSQALVEAVRSFAEDQGGSLPRSVRLRTLSDGEGRFALEARLRDEAGVTSVADDGLRPGVRLGWYVPFVPPGAERDVARGRPGFAFCLENRSGHLDTVAEPARDGAEVTVGTDDGGGCGEAPTVPAS